MCTDISLWILSSLCYLLVWPHLDHPCGNVSELILTMKQRKRLEMSFGRARWLRGSGEMTTVFAGFMNSTFTAQHIQQFEAQMILSAVRVGKGPTTNNLFYCHYRNYHRFQRAPLTQHSAPGFISSFILISPFLLVKQRQSNDSRASEPGSLSV